MEAQGVAQAVPGQGEGPRRCPRCGAEKTRRAKRCERCHRRKQVEAYAPSVPRYRDVVCPLAAGDPLRLALMALYRERAAANEPLFAGVTGKFLEAARLAADAGVLVPLKVGTEKESRCKESRCRGSSTGC